MKRVLLALVRFYRRAISPFRPPACRYTPTCSQYALEAIEKYGALKGGWMAFRPDPCAVIPSTKAVTTPFPDSKEYRRKDKNVHHWLLHLRTLCLAGSSVL